MSARRIRVSPLAPLTLAVACVAAAAAAPFPPAVPLRGAGPAPSTVPWSALKERAELLRCAPRVSPLTMAALVAQESGGDPYALDDDSSHIVYHPVSYAGAVRLAAQLIGAGHSVDLGLAQVNSGWLAPLRLTAAELLEPCENLRAGSLILMRAWRAAGAGPVPGASPRAKRLARALAIYHSGNPRSLAGRQYAVETFRHAGVRIVVPAISGGHLARWGHDPRARRGALRQPTSVQTLAARWPSPRASALWPNDHGLAPASLSPVH